MQTKDRISKEQFDLLPQEIKNLINLYRKRNPKINWKRALKIFSSSSRRTRIRITNKVVNAMGQDNY